MAAIADLHRNVTVEGRIGGAVGSVAMLTTTVALIAIVSASFCLTLPGVNALTQVIYPAIIPASVVLALSIPLIVLAVKSARLQTKNYKALIDRAKELLDEKVQTGEKKEHIAFIRESLTRGKELVYNMKFLTDLKKAYPEAEQKEEAKNPSVMAIDGAMKKMTKG